MGSVQTYATARSRCRQYPLQQISLTRAFLGERKVEVLIAHVMLLICVVAKKQTKLEGLSYP